MTIDCLPINVDDQLLLAVALAHVPLPLGKVLLHSVEHAPPAPGSGQNRHPPAFFLGQATCGLSTWSDVSGPRRRNSGERPGSGTTGGAMRLGGLDIGRGLFRESKISRFLGDLELDICELMDLVANLDIAYFRESFW